MNQKFFDVKKEKQDAIINAALQAFGENGYKRASTDVIVKQAGISKGLLFHYFISKQGLYSFIYDYSVRFMTLEMTQTVKTGESDFFELIKQMEQAKTRVMKNYPYMEKFLDSIKFEKHPEALAALNDSDKKDAMEQLYNGLYKQTDLTKFKDKVDIKRVIRMIDWCSEGFMKEAFEHDPDLDDMNAEFAKYIKMLQDNLYRPEFVPATDDIDA
ncbi:MAG TPA: TetR/AcrR family transcriptional regulator [Lachnospiraceae bacterium]|jgi:TetR/AcrR family transcriptional regulator|nr:TetR/AcrR family transcriptional regulator [Lachnospiraceae bacterium]